MGKRKQSKASWRKRGQPLEDAALHARRQADQDLRAGGSAIAGLSDSQLFALDSKAGGAKPVGLGHKRVPRPERRLRIDEILAPNPHIPTVTKPETAPSKPGAQSREERRVREAGAGEGYPVSSLHGAAQEGACTQRAARSCCGRAR